MSSKRSRPYEEPPSPESESGSDESESESESEEQNEQEQEQTPTTPKPTQQQQQQQQQQSESDDDDDDDDEDNNDEDEDDKIQTPVPLTQAPASESKIESETESQSEPDSPKASSYTIKPNNNNNNNNTDNALSKPVDDNSSKKGIFNRVWGYDDEIAVLQGLIDFKRVYSKDPPSNYDEFYNFIRPKIGGGKFSKVQVIDKIRRMKNKFKNILGKSFRGGGKDPEFSNPHDLKFFQLGRKVWGNIDGTNNNNVNDSNNNNANASASASLKSHPTIGVVALPVQGDENGFKSSNSSNVKGKSAKKSKALEKVAHVDEHMSTKKSKALEKVARVDEHMMEVDEEEEKKGNEDFGELYPHLMKAFDGEYLPRVPMLNDLKTCFSKVDSVQLEEWDRKWKKVRIAETEAYVNRLALIQEQTRWFADAMKSSKN